MIYTFAEYRCIPRQNSTYFSEDIFEELENDINYYSSRGSILLLGDLNARTGKYNDFLEAPHRCFLDIDEQENVTPVAYRNNCDNVLNEHGKALLKICKNCDLRILNGRKKGDSLGNVTFHGRNGVSTVDYIICDEQMFENMQFFVVKPPTPVSDHSQIVSWLNVTSLHKNDDESTINFQKLQKLTTQFVWEDDSPVLFTQALQSPGVQYLVEDYLNRQFPNTELGVDKAVE